MRGRVAVVTGGSAGIGRETARGLAAAGATVALVVRSRERGEDARRDIAAATGGDVHLVLADLALQRDVRRAAAEVRDRFGAVHVLVNNAATYARRREATAEGIEMQLAVNHLAPFLLTGLLLDTLRASAPARVVTVSSGAHRGRRIPWDDLQAERRYRAFPRYGETKLMNLLFTRELARRLDGSGVTANAVHPGVVGTELLFGGLGLLRLFRRWMKTPAEGAVTSLHAALSPEGGAVTGRYFVDAAPAETDPAARDDAAAARLWRVSAELTGLDA
jgi:NAD(P)-dependent dehydrogenase (short-subunit alcohol dehydrogenase family)